MAFILIKLYIYIYRQLYILFESNRRNPGPIEYKPQQVMPYFQGSHEIKWIMLLGVFLYQLLSELAAYQSS